MDAMDTASELACKYLRLQLCPGVGAVRFARLLAHFGEIDALLAAPAASLAGVRGIGHQLAESIARNRDATDVAGEIDLARRYRARILCIADEQYPAILRMIDDPPACLYVRGTFQPEDAIALAIVGSRYGSRYGAEQAERFGALAANAGLTVVSGLARGTDSAAHRGALDAGGRTIAVLGCGLCHLYPPESKPLAREITENGAVISALPMDTPPDAKNFPPRNRIIAGLSLGTLVVEAARRSGALITARLACEYNREVFALPGRIDTPHAEGCNDLIQKGAAKLVTNLTDVLVELGEAGSVLMKDEESEPAASVSRPELTANEQAVVRTLEAEALSVETICELCPLPPARVASTLTGLQLKGVIRRVRGDLFECARRTGAV